VSTTFALLANVEAYGRLLTDDSRGVHPMGDEAEIFIIAILGGK